MNNKKLFSLLLILSVIISASAAAWRTGILVSEDFAEFSRQVDILKKQAYQNLPIYSDYMTFSREKKLRTYLLADHLEIAESLDLQAATDKESIRNLIQEQKLLKIKRDSNSLFYFYNVPAGNRYLRDFALDGLKLLAREFQSTLQSRGYRGKVKFAVTSALRGQKYQQALRKRNMNAVIKSSHAYGISFDVFFDEYFAVVEKPDSSLFTENSATRRFISRSGYLLGGNMRRQFKAAMAETLIRLQDKGLIYAILEKRQRCFHVTILKK